VRLDPDWALNHANLGALYAAQGDAEAARRELQAAVKLAPRVAAYHLNLGAVAEQTGNGAEAEQAYAEALHYRPEWADAYFWRATPWRAAFLARWRSSTLTAPAPTAVELDSRLALVEAHIQAGQLPDAERLLQRTSLVYPQSLVVVWVKAELAAARADYTKAAALGEKALTGYRDQSIFGPGTFGDPAYGPFYQRREAMALDMVPQLTVIRVTDPWAARLVTLGDWYAALGDAARAAAIYREVLTYVPDNAEAQARLR
jgi:tetratricopeptide (TPR) repeat protein